MLSNFGFCWCFFDFVFIVVLWILDWIISFESEIYYKLVVFVVWYGKDVLKNNFYERKFNDNCLIFKNIIIEIYEIIMKL